MPAHNIGKGEDWKPGEVGDMATAGISIDSHRNAIEIHRDTLAEAQKIRDWLLELIHSEQALDLYKAALKAQDAVVDYLSSESNSFPKQEAYRRITAFCEARVAIQRHEEKVSG